MKYYLLNWKNGATQENVPEVPAPTREEVNDQDTSDQAPTEIPRSTKHDPHQSGTVILF